MKYKDQEIPVGVSTTYPHRYTASKSSSNLVQTPISSTPYITLMSPIVFPHPEEFLPERWLLENGEYNRGLEKYMVGWGKGPRQCIGIR